MHDMEEAMKHDEKELEEAKATIETLRKDLQEVNLLNAKYLYMNKLFKSKSLTEAQKVKVINALDRATNVAEVKQTYETLKESFETKKQAIKESIGFASKPAGVAPKANIVEADTFINRWQKLAGIK
jgi:DNA repair exonuclease SbcCD ATPase subunit